MYGIFVRVKHFPFFQNERTQQVIYEQFWVLLKCVDAAKVSALSTSESDSASETGKRHDDNIMTMSWQYGMMRRLHATNRITGRSPMYHVDYDRMSWLMIIIFAIWQRTKYTRNACPNHDIRI